MLGANNRLLNDLKNKNLRQDKNFKLRKKDQKANTYLSRKKNSAQHLSYLNRAKTPSQHQHIYICVCTRPIKLFQNGCLS